MKVTYKPQFPIVIQQFSSLTSGNRRVQQDWFLHHFYFPMSETGFESSVILFILVTSTISFIIRKVIQSQKKPCLLLQYKVDSHSPTCYPFIYMLA
jgi:hypothetical protein